MPDQMRPLPDDPDGETVTRMFGISAGDWILSAPGDYQAAAAETMLNDGSGHQRVVILEWPGRYNHTDEHTTVRLIMSPEDAQGLSRVLDHTATWMLRR